MSPTEYVREMQRHVVLKEVLTPKQILEAQTLLDEGYKYIGKRLEENFTDMTPDAVSIATMLQQFLLVFVDHATNFALLRKMEASG